MSSAEQISPYPLPIMGSNARPAVDSAYAHPWVRPIGVAVEQRVTDPLLDPLLAELRASFRAGGNRIGQRPSRSTRLIITCARLGEVISTSEAILFRAKLMFKLAQRPTVLTLVSVPRAAFSATLASLAELGQASDAELEAFSFTGMPGTGLPILREEVRRVGPIQAFSRLVQVAVKSMRVGAVVGDEATGTIDGVYLFDLAGGYPFVSAPRLDLLASELAARLVTVVNASDADHHEHVSAPVPREQWERSTAPEAMIEAGQDLGRRSYLTAPVHLKDFGFRAMGRLVSEQYSEGCLATYDPQLGVLLTTATGSARVVDKRNITRGDIAIVLGVKPDGSGARIAHTEKEPLVKPSVEAVELARIAFGSPRFQALERTVPLSIIHLHMGIAAYNPEVVEYAPLDPAFYTFPVSCGTRELADGTAGAFARSSVLGDLHEARQVVVLEQPTHGCILVAIGVDARPPFHQIFEAIDQGHLALSFDIPQGPVRWQTTAEGRMQKAEDRRQSAVVTGSMAADA